MATSPSCRRPLWSKDQKSAFIEFSRRHGDFAIVSAAALVEVAANRIARVSLTIGGIAAAPVRADAVEQAIAGEAPSHALFRTACESCRALEAMADIHASADYRRHLAAVLSRRALERACGLAAPAALH
jgi:carbon-monoxide dehydrogenase medium subunit